MTFVPAKNATLACSSSTGSTAFAVPVAVGNEPLRCEIKNVGVLEGFVAFGSSTVTATAGGSSSAADDGSYSVPSGAVLFISVQKGQTHFAGVCASGSTTTLRLAFGHGV